MMIRTIVVAVSLIFSAHALLGQTAVSLSGTVTKTGSSTGIEGVTVALAKAPNLFANTNATGAFTIIGDIDVSTQWQTPQASRLYYSLAGNILIISSLPLAATGRVELYLSDGRKIASTPFRGNAGGKLRIGLPELGSGLTMLRIITNGETVTRTIVRLGEALYLKDARVAAGTDGKFALEKQAAAAIVDTLIASKTGYTTKKVPIDSYTKQSIAIALDASDGTMPFVYDKEYTGSDCPKPTLVADPTTLPAITYLPDPFLKADGSRITTKAEWRCRRAEILETIMKYEGGQKPPKPEKFNAALNGNTINISCGVGSNTINMTATISRPSNAPSGPIPAIINKGSLQLDFTGKGIATINFNFGQLTGDAFSGGYNTGNFYKLYPNTDAGYMIRWAWGVSRVIDALEMLPDANIDTKRLAVSGCSYQGKIALYSGAFDERIALTIPHESGGGGTISWRYSDMLEDRDRTEVENLHHAQGAAWYAEILKKYVPTSMSPNSLPFDQHELMGLCLPRAIFCIESSMIARMGAEAARVDALALRRMYSAFGI